MTSIARFIARLPLCVAAFAAVGASAQQAAVYETPGQIRQDYAEAEAQGRAARIRAEKLEADADRATVAVERTAREAAGVASRIQQTEAEIAAIEARIHMIAQQREALRARLAERQKPLVELTAALQRLSRRPPVFSLLRPGSLADTVHTRAVLETVLPQVQGQTVALRADIARARALQLQANAVAASLRVSQARLRSRRLALAALESRQRLASWEAVGTASREAERALALAEKARDLDALAAEFTRAAVLREQLARLPGPVLRPARPEDAKVLATEAPASPEANLPAYILPVSGRVVAGFGESSDGTVPRSRGIALAARPGTQAVAPAAGRVAFAGRYQGYGEIVIIEHGGGWTSLVTGLAQLETQVGESLVTGSPIGRAGFGRPVITLELRRRGEPVNPLEYLRAP